MRDRAPGVWKGEREESGSMGRQKREREEVKEASGRD